MNTSRVSPLELYRPNFDSGKHFTSGEGVVEGPTEDYEPPKPQDDTYKKFLETAPKPREVVVSKKEKTVIVERAGLSEQSKKIRTDMFLGIVHKRYDRKVPIAAPSNKANKEQTLEIAPVSPNIRILPQDHEELDRKENTYVIAFHPSENEQLREPSFIKDLEQLGISVEPIDNVPPFAISDNHLVDGTSNDVDTAEIHGGLAGVEIRMNDVKDIINSEMAAEIASVILKQVGNDGKFRALFNHTLPGDTVVYAILEKDDAKQPGDTGLDTERKLGMAVVR